MPIRTLLLHDPRRALPSPRAAPPDVIVLDARTGALSPWGRGRGEGAPSSSESPLPLPSARAVLRACSPLPTGERIPVSRSECDGPAGKWAASEGQPSPFHSRPSGPGLYACLSPLSSETIGSELEWAASIGVDGVVLTEAVGRRDVEHLGAKLAVIEAERGLPDGGLRILAVAADTPAGALALPSFSPASRLIGLACDPRRLSLSLGCEAAAPAIMHARALTVLAAASCDVQAVLVGTSFAAKDMAAAEREGFGAVLAPASGGQARVGRRKENFVSGVATK